MLREQEPTFTDLSYCITKLSSDKLINGHSDYTTANEKRKEKKKITHKLVSTELWLRIFNNLDRNEIDNCEHVCVNWRQIIRSNKKRLPGREIDYIIISSKRVYSIITSSNNIIKAYQFTKYYDERDINTPINDYSHMRVRTYRRKQMPSKVSTEKQKQLKESTERPFQYYIDELRPFIQSTLIGQCRCESLSGKKEESADPLGRFFERNKDAIDLKYPPSCLKTNFKLKTPPKLFFQKLNDLLRNHIIVRYFVLQTFTLTNSFVTKFLQYVRPINAIGMTKLMGVKKGKIKISGKAIAALLVLLNDDNIEERMPVGESRMINI